MFFYFSNPNYLTLISYKLIARLRTSEFGPKQTILERSVVYIMTIEVLPNISISVINVLHDFLNFHQLHVLRNGRDSAIGTELFKIQREEGLRRSPPKDDCLKKCSLLVIINMKPHLQRGTVRYGRGS